MTWHSVGLASRNDEAVYEESWMCFLQGPEPNIAREEYLLERVEATQRSPDLSRFARCLHVFDQSFARLETMTLLVNEGLEPCIRDSASL